MGERSRTERGTMASKWRFAGQFQGLRHIWGRIILYTESWGPIDRRQFDIGGLLKDRQHETQKTPASRRGAYFFSWVFVCCLGRERRRGFRQQQHPGRFQYSQ